MAFYLQNSIRAIVALLALVVICSCKDKVATKDSNNQELIMYQPSEMAKLMNAFYSYNETLKTAIINGDSLLPIPVQFKDIHTASMTNANGRTAIFNTFAPAYLEAQQHVLDTLSHLDIKTRYNTTINMCIACHKTECVGPITRIKKLLID